MQSTEQPELPDIPAEVAWLGLGLALVKDANDVYMVERLDGGTVWRCTCLWGVYTAHPDLCRHLRVAALTAPPLSLPAPPAA